MQSVIINMPFLIHFIACIKVGKAIDSIFSINLTKEKLQNIGFYATQMIHINPKSQ